MLNYSKGNNYVIALVVTILICVVLFICFDYSILKETSVTNNTEISKWIIMEKESL